jgi:hypothetical protein
MWTSVKKCAVLLTLAFCTSSLVAQESPATAVPPAPQLDSHYAVWEVKVPEGSTLARIRDTYTAKGKVWAAAVLTGADVEDTSPLPLWFRLYLRDHLQQLPTEGSYQYARVADQILDWMVNHPDLKPSNSKVSLRTGKLRTVAVPSGFNVNLTNFNERNSESSIAVDYSNPQYVIAASNNIKTSGYQKQFYSTDGGKSWNATQLPALEGIDLHSDPSVGAA